MGALVPSTMELLGNANWWLPKWLDRLVPRVSIEAPMEFVPEPVAELAGER
jgi:RND superfamily putative drug exporter